MKRTRSTGSSEVNSRKHPVPSVIVDRREAWRAKRKPLRSHDSKSSLASLIFNTSAYEQRRTKSFWSQAPCGIQTYTLDLRDSDHLYGGFLSQRFAEIGKKPRILENVRICYTY